MPCEGDVILVTDCNEGGYHPVAIGERYRDGRYIVLQKLGWGHFSTVWLVQDTRCHRKLAMKVREQAVLSHHVLS